MRDPRCPLCDAPVGDDDELRDHLADVHDLRDDPGTSTQVETLDPFISLSTDAATAAAVAGEPPALRVYDPDADDERWRPIVIGVGGILLLIIAAVAVSLGL